MPPPLYTPAEARARETFLALMWALSYPGRIYDLPDAAPPFELIGEALLDLETSYVTNDAALAQALGRNGARRLPPELAAYHLYPTLTEDDLPSIAEASIGTPLYPDRSATLFIGASLGTGAALRLTGAGIPGEAIISVGGLPRGFWTLRNRRRRYPLGWDIYLIDGRRVIGLPRSTQIEHEEGA